VDQYHDILKTQAEHHGPKLLKKYGLLCKQLPYGDDAPLYIAKPSWTNRFDENREAS